jgi:predicted ester cyclase
LRDFREALAAAFPDFHFAIASIVAEGDEVAWRGTAAATQRKGFDGLAPMGRHAGFMVGEFYRIVNGKIAEAWVFYDTRSVRQQLGAS